MDQGKHIAIPIAVVVILLFVAGLIASFAVGGMFGVPPPLFWAGLVVTFVVGVLCLQKPKFFLLLVFLYYGFMFNGLLLGKYYVPIPMISRVDEFLLIIPLALIVMKAIQRELPRKATFFPLAYVLLFFLSYKVNEPPLMNSVRIGLAYFKFYIFWYFARCIGPWSQREKRMWFLFFVGFAAIQYPLNVIWNRAPYLVSSDLATGSLGNPHLNGYFDCIGFLLLAGWFLSPDNRKTPLRLAIAVPVTLMIGYDLIFMTDTKHVLVMFPVIALPFLFTPRLRIRTRLALVVASLVFAALSFWYIQWSAARRGHTLPSPEDYIISAQRSGKGHVFETIIDTLPARLPLFHFVGAGPGNFCSSVAVHSYRPLAMQHVLPYVIEGLRTGKTTSASVIGGPVTSLFTLWGEFGIPLMVIYLAFWTYVILRMWRRAYSDEHLTFEAGQMLALISSLLLIVALAVLMESFSMGILLMPVWTLIGMHWDEVERPKAKGKPAAKDPVPPSRTTPVLTPH